MDLFGTLKVLVRVAETGSFSAVSRERELTQGAIAKQISQLEEHFGVRLFHRTTRKLSLTDDGQVLLHLARPVLDSVEGMAAAVGRQSASAVGLVRVGVTGTCSRFLTQRLPIWLADKPGLKVELVVSDRFGDMIEDRLDLALRMGEVTDASLVLRRRWTGELVAVAAPRYIERCGTPLNPADLLDHTCIVHDVGSDSDVWTFVMPQGPRGFRVSGGFLATDVRAIRQAAESGYGIALLPLFGVFDDLRCGKLVRVLGGFSAPALPISLVYPSRRHLPPRTRLVLEFILGQIREVRVMMESGEDKARDVQGVQRLDQRFRNERTDSAEHPRRVPAEILEGSPNPRG
jgi:DNA-binding transcriptional LysR family regulator